MQPKNQKQILIKKGPEIKHFVAHQMQNFQGKVAWKFQKSYIGQVILLRLQKGLK